MGEPTQDVTKAGLDITATGAIAAGIAIISTGGDIVTGVVLVIIGSALFAVKRFLV